MLATYSSPNSFMYSFNGRQHPVHNPNPIASYPSSIPPQFDHSSIELENSWSDSHPRYGVPGPTNGFVNDLQKNVHQPNVFTSTSQGSNGRSHYNYAPSVERSTVQPFQQEWPSPSLSPGPVNTPVLPPASAAGQMYQSPFGRNAMGHNSAWNQWSGNPHSDVLGLRPNSSVSPMTHYSDLRVAPFPSPALDDLLYTNSPEYHGATDLPPMQPTRGYQMSPISSPSPSPSTSSQKLSPKLSVSPSPSSRRGSVDSSTGGKRCSHCQATSTPLWRREPTTLKPLCNACGLYLQQRHRHRPKELIDADQEDDESEEEDQNYSGPECSHCHTHRTSVWRRSKTGAQLCNACGVYARLRGKDRPLSLKRKKIKPRTKHASATSRSP